MRSPASAFGRAGNRIRDAITQTQAERDGANVEMLHLGHAHGLQDFGLGILHKKKRSEIRGQRSVVGDRKSEGKKST